MASYKLYITYRFLENCFLKEVRFQILSFFLNGYGTRPQGLGQGLVFQSATAVSTLTGHNSRHWGCKKSNFRENTKMTMI